MEKICFFEGLGNTSQYQYGKGVNSTLTFCLCLLQNLIMVQGSCAWDSPQHRQF